MEEDFPDVTEDLNERVDFCLRRQSIQDGRYRNAFERRLETEAAADEPSAARNGARAFDLNADDFGYVIRASAAAGPAPTIELT